MVRKKIKAIICSIITIVMISSSMTVFAEELSVLKGNFDIVVEGFDWGPGVTKVIVTLDDEVSNVTKDTFKVEEVKEGMFEIGLPDIGVTERIITDSYLVDENGNKTDEPSKKILIELAVSPDEGSPFKYNILKGANTWANPYELNISLAEGEKLIVDGKEVSTLEINNKYINKYLPTVDKFKESLYESEGDISMNYAYYSPVEDNNKNPLIIWLHGAGEGEDRGGYNNDTTVTTLGNKVGALITDEIQSEFGGTYVLAPQSPTMWMDSTGNRTYTEDGSSIYLESLMNLIKSYVDSNDDIDTNRIYIGGCSNGGYMTMALILENPEYFAAAYPICEAFSDEWISDENLEEIKDMPIWFTYANNDNVVNPQLTSVATINRLRNIGAKDVKVSEFENVIDTSGLYKNEDGTSYEYNGHFSWIYALNDECKDGDDKLWTWLASKSKETSVDNPTDEPSDNPTDEPSDEPITSPTDDSQNDLEEVIVDGNKDNDDNTDEESPIYDKLPNTGAPISSMVLPLLGTVAIVAGIKIRMKK